MCKKIRKLICFLLVVAMTVNVSTIFHINCCSAVQDSYKVGDIVYFGNYFQNVLAEDDASYASQLTYDENGVHQLADGRWVAEKTYVNGLNLIYQYFCSEPIKWIVIKKENDSLLLMAEQVLASRNYGEFWDESSLRGWLNNEFLKYGFTEKEKNDILPSTIRTFKLPYNDYLSSGNGYVVSDDVDSYTDTQDKVYILDKYEIDNMVDGKYRVATATNWASSSDGNPVSEWWIRGPAIWFYGNLLDIYVKNTGDIDDRNISAMSTGRFAGKKGVRPVIKVKANSSYLNKKKPTFVSISSMNDAFINVTADYKSKVTDSMRRLSARYSNSYFKKDSTKENRELALLSIVGASSAYNSKSRKKFLKDCGFNDVISEYSAKKIKKPTKKDNDHVRYVFGHKTLVQNGKSYELFAILVKGTSTDYEWVSNFEIGKGNVHKGFNNAAKEVKEKFLTYVKKYKENRDVKVWITGHSRGAAVANILGNNLNTTYNWANIYTYTFATPRVVQKSKKRKDKNIFNYLNIGDFVTEVAPKKWKYERYGKDISFKNTKAMKSQFYNLTYTQYKGFTKKAKNKLLKAFVSLGKSRKAYYKGYKSKVKKVYPYKYAQKGIGYFLAGKTKAGVKNIVKYGGSLKAAHVTVKMLWDGMVTPKFIHSHSQEAYYAYLKSK